MSVILALGRKARRFSSSGGGTRLRNESSTALVGRTWSHEEQRGLREGMVS